MLVQRAKQPHIIFHVGGPAFHPVSDQARQIVDWLGSSVQAKILEGLSAFEELDECDLLVLMGLQWTGMNQEWAGSLTYHPMQPQHQHAFERYVASGRPLLAHHGAIASYDDWPRFGELIGFTWQWGVTSHSPFGIYPVHILPTGHPVITGIEDYIVEDELYYDVQVTPGLQPEIHAIATWEGRDLPMVMTATGGRIAGAGRTAYLANGHDLRAFTTPALALLWRNTVDWLLETVSL